MKLEKNITIHESMLKDFVEYVNKGWGKHYAVKDILEEICQAIRDYETEKERIETVCEDNYDNITNDGIAILEKAARKAYFEGELVV